MVTGEAAPVVWLHLGIVAEGAQAQAVTASMLVLEPYAPNSGRNASPFFARGTTLTRDYRCDTAYAARQSADGYS